MTDRQRNTFQYGSTDIIVEPDIESVSGITFLVRDKSLPGEAYSGFAYFDDIKRFIECGCNWDVFIKS